MWVSSYDVRTLRARMKCGLLEFRRERRSGNFRACIGVSSATTPQSIWLGNRRREIVSAMSRTVSGISGRRGWPAISVRDCCIDRGRWCSGLYPTVTVSGWVAGPVFGRRTSAQRRRGRQFASRHIGSQHAGGIRRVRVIAYVFAGTTERGNLDDSSRTRTFCVARLCGGDDDSLSVTEANVTRLRLGLKGTWRLRLKGEARLTWCFEFAVRRYGGVGVMRIRDSRWIWRRGSRVNGTAAWDCGGANGGGRRAARPGVPARVGAVQDLWEPRMGNHMQPRGDRCMPHFWH